MGNKYFSFQFQYIGYIQIIIGKMVKILDSPGERMDFSKFKFNMCAKIIISHAIRKNVS